MFIIIYTMTSRLLKGGAPAHPTVTLAYPYNTLYSPYFPSNATIEPYPSLPSFTTTVPITIAPGVVIPSTTTITPQLPLSPNLDLDNDYETRKKVADYFYYLTIDKWLYKDLSSLLNYLAVSGDKVSIIKKSEFSKSNTDKDTNQTAERKIRFIETYVLSKGDVYNILLDFTKENGIKWASLIKTYADDVKYVIKKKIKKRLSKKMD
jgi:hypothetical protein